MTTLTSLPPAPQRNDPANFATKADAWVSALEATFTPEMNLIIPEINALSSSAVSAASTASTAATNADISAANAATASGAPMWVSGSTYALGAATWSSVNRLVYRKITASSVSTIDPSSDPTNWALLGTVGLSVVVVTGTSVNAAANGHYVLTNVAATTVTLPASPLDGTTVAITPFNALLTNVAARNAGTIMSLSEDMTLDNQNATVTLRFLNNTWRLV